MNNISKTMRDAVLEKIYERMRKDKNIFFLSADMGAPCLDKIRANCADRFMNVGIAEQNLINTASGLALEGMTVYALAIAPFFMRACEQIRVNLALMGQERKLNVNMLAVGTGVSYDVSGPTHHCLEDISIMRTFPNIMVLSPADWVTAASSAAMTFDISKPKYIRLDGKPQPAIYSSEAVLDWAKGFFEIRRGGRACIVSTGYMTQKALALLEMLKTENIDAGLIDVFMPYGMDEEALGKAIDKYEGIVTAEEGFIGKGGLDSIVLRIVNELRSRAVVKSLGFDNKYVFKYGSREFLYSCAGCEQDVFAETVRNVLK